MGSISESLFESELFGHRKGAFTGANEDRIGRIQAANGGTLFLDEIGNLPLHLQAKLLSVLEQREVTAVGSDRSQPLMSASLRRPMFPPATCEIPNVSARPAVSAQHRRDRRAAVAGSHGRHPANRRHFLASFRADMAA